MHLEKRRAGKHTTYFLAHSYREGSQVHKFRKYLGRNLSRELLQERQKIAEKLILEEIHKYRLMRDPLRVELSKKDITLIKKLEKDIPLHIHHLSEKQWKLFSELFTYNTNAIEGSTLSKEEVRELLEHDKWPDRSKEDIAEAFGVDEAVSYIRSTKDHLSIALMQKLHKIVFKNSKPFAGQLRKKGEEVVVMGSDGRAVHEGAPQPRVKHLLRELVRWYAEHKQTYPGLLLAAVVHNQFENIHPFRDGNGRVGRLLMNNILLKHDLPPLNIDLKNRFVYYEALQAYEKAHNLQPTLKLFMKEYVALQKKLGDYKTTQM